MARSQTAEYVAFYRALESLERRREPLFRDPYAPLFLGPRLTLALGATRLPAVHRATRGYVDRRAPGARLSYVARTRLIDDLGRVRVASGAPQIVVLGAGFDCRAHRLAEWREIPVFEVDLPGTQAEKRARLRQVSGSAHPDVRYVPADLARDDVGARLAEARFDAARPALFMLEGVTNYLPEEAVSRVLAWLGRAAPGSTLIFSYVDRGLLDGTLDFPGSDRFRRAVRTLREPWVSGLHPRGLGAELARVGLSLREDLGADEYRRRYLGPAPGSERFAFYRLAVAEVG